MATKKRKQRRKKKSNFSGNITSASNILGLSQNQLDVAFANAGTRAVRVDEEAERKAQREWVREYGVEASARKNRLRRERNWKVGPRSIPEVDEFQRRPGSPYSLSRKRTELNRTKSFSGVRSGSKKDVAPLEQTTAGITFERYGAEKSFECYLEREAVSTVVEREGYMDKLRQFLRKNENHSRLQGKQRELWEKRLLDCIDKVRESTLTCILSISKWENCFVDPRPFMYCGANQENVNYLLAAYSSLDFLEQRPAVMALLRERYHASPNKDEFSMIRNPLIQLEKPQHLEVEALSALDRQELAFGRLSDSTHRCKWCCAIPEPGKYGGQSLVNCTGAHCHRGKYCKQCIVANCGGIKGYNLIKVGKSWTCFVCEAEAVRISLEQNRIAQEHAKKMQQRKKETESKLRHQKQIEREQSKANRKRRRIARNFLARRVRMARTHLAHQRTARVYLKNLSIRYLQVGETRRVACRWLRQQAFRAFNECDEISSLLRQVEPAPSFGTVEEATPPILSANPAASVEPTTVASSQAPLSPTDGDKLSSLDFLEQEQVLHRASENVKTESDKPESIVRPYVEDWLAFGKRVNLRLALRVVHFEICLVTIRSTEKNPEIVKVVTYVSSLQKHVDRVLLHKSQVKKEKWNNELLVVLRQKAHSHLQRSSEHDLRETAARAKHLLNHNRTQYQVMRVLKRIGSKAVARRALQQAAFKWLNDRAQHTKDHLYAQIQARKELRWLGRRVKKHQEVQRMTRRELRAISAQVRQHLVRQRMVRMELVGTGSHAKVHLFNQQRAKAFLLEVVATSI